MKQTLVELDSTALADEHNVSRVANPTYPTARADEHK
jgi:hypothetical protein